MATKLGIDARAYYLPTGERATWGAAGADGIHSGSAPSGLTEMTNVKDVTLTLNKGEADVTTRGANGWRLMRGTLKEGEIQFESIWDPSDAVFAKLFGAWLNNTTIAMAFLDGDKATAGTQGLWADFDVTGFEKKEPLEEAQTASITVKPTKSEVAPEWVKVGA